MLLNEQPLRLTSDSLEVMQHLSRTPHQTGPAKETGESTAVDRDSLLFCLVAAKAWNTQQPRASATGKKRALVVWLALYPMEPSLWRRSHDQRIDFDWKLQPRSFRLASSRSFA